jgi:dUTP pyrophosphatase
MIIKRFCEGAPEPVRKTEGSVGYDLPACATYEWGYGFVDTNGGRYVANHEGSILIPLGWGFEIPPGYVGLLEPRSSTSHWLLGGRIDWDYRGQVFAKTTMDLVLKARPTVKMFDRIAQLIIVPVLTPEMVEGEFETVTARGDGGYGSTGR